MITHFGELTDASFPDVCFIVNNLPDHIWRNWLPLFFQVCVCRGRNGTWRIYRHISVSLFWRKGWWLHPTAFQDCSRCSFFRFSYERAYSAPRNPFPWLYTKAGGNATSIFLFPEHNQQEEQSGKHSKVCMDGDSVWKLRHDQFTDDPGQKDAENSLNCFSTKIVFAWQPAGYRYGLHGNA